MPLETLRILYADRIARLAAELGDVLAVSEERLEDAALAAFFGDVEAAHDRHVTATLIALASPLAEKLEAGAVDLLDLAVKAAAQDVLAQAMRARTTQALSRGGGVER
jgi:hypothetical protein